MALTVQNLRAVGIGVEPTSLLPGQLAFNITDKVIYVGDGSSFKTNFDGTQVAGTPGEGWYSMPMDFDTLGDYYVANPAYYGDTPTDQQVLAWSTALGHPVWSSGAGGGGNQIYVVTNAQVAAAPGSTTSAKISAAIGVVSPDEGNVTIVTGLPDEVYEGLYFFTGVQWLKGAAYAYPSASEVIYNNVAHPTLGATVQAAIDDLDNGLAATTAIANTANSTATSALNIASAALPRSGGTMTGPLISQNIDVPTGFSVLFAGGTSGTLFGITNSTSTFSANLAASATAVKSAYDLANAAIPDSTFTAAGEILVGTGAGTYSPLTIGANGDVLVVSGGTPTWVANTPGDVTSVSGTSPVTVNNTDPENPVVGINAASTSAPGAVQLNDTTISTSTIEAATANAVRVTKDVADAALPRAGGTMTGGLTLNAALIDGAGLPGSVDQVLKSTGATVLWVDDAPGDVTSVTGTAPVVVNNTDSQNPIVSVNTATTTSLGVVSVGDNISVLAGAISVPKTTTANLGVVQVELTGNIDIVDGVINVADGTTTGKGVVQLYAGLDDSSNALALTAGAGKNLQDQITGLTLSNSVILAGGYNASTGLVDGVTTQGTAAGFADNVAPPAADATTVDHYLICVVAGSTPSTMENGDWLLAVETSPGVYAYQVLGVGSRPPTASYTQAGIVQLADAAAVLSGLSDTTAITPNALQDNVSDSVSTANSYLIASSQAVKTANDAAVAAQGTANTGVANAAAAQATADAALPKAGGTMTGNLVFAGTQTTATTSAPNIVQLTDSTSSTSITTAATPNSVKSAYDLANTANNTANAALPLSGGTVTGNITFQDAGEGVVFNGGSQVFAISDSTSTTSSTTASSSTAVKAAFDAAGTASGAAAAAQATADAALPKAGGTMTGNITFQDAGEGVVFSGGSSIIAISDATGNTNSDIAASSTAVKDAYALADAAVPKSCYTALGALTAGTGASTVGTLTIGTNGQVLAANSGCSTGVQWCTLSLACIPCSVFTAAGQLLAGTGTSTFTALNVGSNNQILVADSACTGGLKWVTCEGAALIGYTQTASPFNTALGANAGNSLTSGTNNVSIGHDAGTQISTGTNNVFIGFQAGDTLTTGANNIAIGAQAMCASTAAVNNIAIGFAALGYGGAGSGNTALGLAAGANVTTGTNNTFISQNAGDAITTGSCNIAIGYNALTTATTVSGNVAIGNNALTLATGATNVAVGTSAGCAITTGTTNLLVGNTAGDAITTGSNNTIIGDIAGSTTLANNLILAAGTTVKLQVNENGAVGVGTTPTYGTAGQFLTSQGSAATPVWCTLSLACIPCSAFTTTGQLLAGTGSSTFSALTVGTNGQFLSANSACSAGLEWCTLSLACVPCSAFTAAGQLLAGTGTSTFTALSVGTNGQVLIADSACTSGVKWGASLQGYTCAATPFNTALGTNAGDSITSGTDNVTLGYNAGTAITTGSQNVVIGSGAAVSSNAVGVVAVGFCSGQALTTGGCITHIGYVSGRNSTGASNTYVGALTGCAASNTSACGTLLGFCAGSALTTGNGNILVGFQAGRNVNSGANNVAIGTAAFQTATTAINNVAVGCGALSGLSTSSGNTALGHRAMLNASTAANNVAVGCNAGEQLSTGSNNVLVGDSAGDTITTGTQNTFVGSGSGGLVATTSEGNTGLGFSALGQGVTSGAYNVAIGNSAGLAVTSGALNTLIGYTAGQAITTGGSNTLVGRYVGTSTLANNVVLSDGAGTIRFQSNSSGAISLGAGGAYGTAGQILVSGGSGAAPTWTSSGTATANYGSFVRTTTQTNTGGASGNAVSYDTTSSANNFSIVSGSRITAAVAGTYQILASLQVQKTDAGTDDINFWVKKNGVNEPNSAYNLTLQGGNAAQLGYINWVVTLAAGEYVELWWYSADVNARLLADPAVAPYPAVPSSGFIIHPMGA